MNNGKFRNLDDDQSASIAAQKEVRCDRIAKEKRENQVRLV